MASSREHHGMVLKSLARKPLSSYSAEPLFIEHCGLSITNIQAQTVISHKDNTILKIRFPFCDVEVNPRFYWECTESTRSRTEFCTNTT